MAITQVITSPFSYHTETCSHDFHAAMAAFADLLYFAVFTKEVITYPRGNHCNLPMPQREQIVVAFEIQPNNFKTQNLKAMRLSLNHHAYHVETGSVRQV
jgi:hypothetical protein